MFDPFETLDKVEVTPEIEEEMLLIDVGGGNVIGIDEGLLIGIVIGYLLANIDGIFNHEVL